MAETRRSKALLASALAAASVAGCAFSTLRAQHSERALRGAPTATNVVRSVAASHTSTIALEAASLASAGVVFVAATKQRRGRAVRGHRQIVHAVPATVPPAAPESVVVLSDAQKVGETLCKEVAEAAKKAVAERGAFALAIPGGSILKMLAAGSSDLADVPWEKGIMAYVNHKCCPNDNDAATHKKAQDLFLSGWKGLNVITVGGSDDGPAEAQRYEALLKEIPETTLPRDKDGCPVFDLMLIGVGDDGHFGSLYPGRPEILDSSGKWVLSVDMKSPPSITLSPSAIMNSKRIVVASAGVSEKYPQGKSAAMKVAIEGMDGPPAFPAQALRDRAVWLFDEAAASALSPEYTA